MCIINNNATGKDSVGEDFRKASDEMLRKYKEIEQELAKLRAVQVPPPPPQQSKDVCPGCGRCRRCGQYDGIPYIPYNPYPYRPYWPDPITITYTSDTTSTLAGSYNLSSGTNSIA